MELISIKVNCHAGYKADEYPKSFTWNHVKFDIQEVIDRWFEAYNTADTKAINYYKVRTNLVGLFILRHQLDDDHWYIVL